MTASAWRIRRALPADAPAILAIEQACPEAPHWSPAVWMETLASEATSPHARGAFVAEATTGIVESGIAGLTIVGFSVAACAGDLAELETVAVSPSARRQGIGKLLTQAAMDWSREQGAASMELEVRVSSHGAQSLYRTLGFAEQGRRRGYYQNPPEDAVLMSARLQIQASLEVHGKLIGGNAGSAKV